jgi:hypothetical protein
MSKKFRMGKLYHIRFIDHALCMDKVVTCEVCGRLVGEDSETLRLAFWDVLDDDVEMVKANREIVTIIKKAITAHKSISELPKQQQ